MRYPIGQVGIGGRNESWYYVEYDPEAGKAFWVHKWDRVNYKLQSDDGELKVDLNDATNKPYYDEAIKVLAEKHPEWQALRG